MTTLDESIDGNYRDTLGDWVAERTGAEIVAWRRVVAGGRRLGIAVDVRGADGRVRELYLAVETTRRSSHDAAARLGLEAAVFVRLRAAGVPGPEVLALHPSDEAMLMTRAPGHAAYSAIRDREQADAVGRDFMACLARVHQIDPTDGSLAVLGPVREAGAHLTELIDTWADAYRRDSPAPDPVLEFGLRWLRTARPTITRPARLVQGDTGPGNFLFEGDRVTAVLDWELAHFGDPQEDLGWLSMRAAQEPFPDFAGLLRRYAELVAAPLDLPAIRYYRALAEWIVAVIGHLKPRAGLGDSERGNALIYEQLHRRLLVEAIADAMRRRPSGVSAPELPHVRLGLVDDTPRTWLYDMALDQLRESVVPRIDDPLAARRAKGVARTLRVLRSMDRSQGKLEAALTAAASVALGRTVVDGAERAAAVTAAIAAGLPDEDALRYAWIDVQATTDLYRPAMGRLADTHLASLPDETLGGGA
jgi:aminoglycoside phosphotransferase (APT) family kinase protein